MEDSPHSDEFLEQLVNRGLHLKGRIEKLQSYESSDKSQLNDDQIQSLNHKEQVVGAFEEIEKIKTKYSKFLSQRAVTEQENLEQALNKCRLETKEAAVKDIAKVITTFLSSVSKAAKNFDQNEGEFYEEQRATYSLLQLMFSGENEGVEAVAKYYLGNTDKVKNSELSYVDLQKYTTDYASGALTQRRSNARNAAEEAVVEAATAATQKPTAISQKESNDSNADHGNGNGNGYSKKGSHQKLDFKKETQRSIDGNKQVSGDSKWKDVVSKGNNKNKDNKKNNRKRSNNSVKEQKTN